MAAPNGQTLPQPAEAAPEPSMEDILASIRRIIASDQHVGHGRTFGVPAKTAEPVARVQTPSPPGRPVLAPLMPDFDDVASVAAAVDPLPEPPALHDLDAMVLPPAPVPIAATESDEAIRPESHDVFLDSLSGDDADEHYSVDEVSAPIAPEPLVSSSTGASVTSSFQVLAESVLLHDPEMIERLTRDALRPMLKTWLDENLPSMVERLVRGEIERVARGGRSRG